MLGAILKVDQLLPELLLVVGGLVADLEEAIQGNFQLWLAEGQMVGLQCVGATIEAAFIAELVAVRASVRKWKVD